MEKITIRFIKNPESQSYLRFKGGSSFELYLTEDYINKIKERKTKDVAELVINSLERYAVDLRDNRDFIRRLETELVNFYRGSSSSRLVDFDL